MSTLHTALESLRPIDFSDVPIDDLSAFLSEHFAQAELILNSVPPPPGGDDFSRATRSRTDINGATKASEMTNSDVRPPPPTPAHEELRKGWGKPLKVGAKDNPLGVSVYKMAGHDRHGSWFARRSVHEGLGFEKWKRAMQMEFPESLAVQSGPGEGSVRGIGGDRILERQAVEGIGQMEVIELSAKFPPPTSPRDFIELLLTTDNGLSDCSAANSEAGNGPRIIPRHWMVVSIPLDHPDAPPRQGLVRGKYESVELIREIPLAPSKVARSTTDLHDTSSREKSPGRPRGATIGFAESRGKDAKGERLDRQELEGDLELNPVDWIMITRSDPGGGIPRFLVDRGTPPSIAADTVKFLDWACAREDLPPADEDFIEQRAERHEQERRPSYSSLHQSVVAGVTKEMDRSSIIKEDTGSRTGESGGIVSIVTSAVGGGMESIAQYAPQVITNNLPGGFPTAQDRDHDIDNDSTDTSSMDSFTSAEPYYTAGDGSQPPNHDGDQTPVGATAAFLSVDSASIRSLSNKSLGSSASPSRSENQALTSHEKELKRIDAKKRHLDDRLAVLREKQEKAQRDARIKGEEEAVKARERHEREIKKREERHKREVQKLEGRKEREARKLEDRMRKEAEKDAVTKAQRERDEYKQKMEVLEQENRILRDQIGDLQKENTTLVAKMGRSEHGQNALKQLKDDIASETASHKSAASVGSAASVRSKGSPRGRTRQKDAQSSEALADDQTEKL